MRLHLARTLLPLVLCAAAPRAAAHDFWLEPSAWSVDAGQLVTFELRVGDDFRGEVVGRDEDFVERFVVSRDGGDAVPLRALPGRVTPATFLRPETGGRYVAGYQSKPRELKLPAAKFHSYLREEGLEHVIEARREAGTAGTAGHEHYVRCAKTVVAVNAPEAGGKFKDELLGLTLELELLSDPGGEGPIKVRVLHEGKPLEGVLVDLTPRRPKAKARAHGHGHDHDHSHGHGHDHDHGKADTAKEAAARKAEDAAPARSNKDGIVTFPRREAGPWLITAVHMERKEDTDLAEVLPRGDWVSFWASLTVAGEGPQPQGGTERSGSSGSGENGAVPPIPRR